MKKKCFIEKYILAFKGHKLKTTLQHLVKETVPLPFPSTPTLNQKELKS